MFVLNLYKAAYNNKGSSHFFVIALVVSAIALLVTDVESAESHYCYVGLDNNSKERLYNAVIDSFTSVNDQYIGNSFQKKGRKGFSKGYEQAQKKLDMKIGNLKKAIHAGDVVQVGEGEKKGNLTYLKLTKVRTELPMHMTLCYEDGSRFKRCSEISPDKDKLQGYFNDKIRKNNFTIAHFRGLGAKYIVAMLQTPGIQLTDKAHVTIAKVSGKEKINKNFIEGLNQALKKITVTFSEVNCIPQLSQ